MARLPLTKSPAGAAETSVGPQLCASRCKKVQHATALKGRRNCRPCWLIAGVFFGATLA